MNKFDRVTSILIYLQTRTVVTAKELSERFEVSERTVYRDLRTLENAGVPIGAEAGVGYFLDKAYRLPPVVFTRDEGAAMLVGAKFLDSRVDALTQGQYLTALDKIRAVMEVEDQDYLDAIDDNIAVFHPQHVENTAERDVWLQQCKTSLARSQAVRFNYKAGSTQAESQRTVEPVGLYHYSNHWHLIAWCRLREDYRDFRLDRMDAFELMPEQFIKRDYRSLKEYLNRGDNTELHEVVVRFSTEVARYAGEQRYFFGFVEEKVTDEGVEMTFLTPRLEYLTRWLLQYTESVECLRGDIAPIMRRYLSELHSRWSV